ncbi:MAG: hypothetical protein Q4F61_01870 [Candidatus Saccharibacteria bacterium]|nr:hypothetical protein [Candidatus Saccharibacteria bacterium]
MEQNAAAAMPVMDSGNQKSGNGLKIATAIASIVAVCGIGFGIYGMVQSSQKDSQISDLKVQIKDSNGTVTTIETPEIETTTNDGTTVTITDTVVDGYKNFADNLAKNYAATVFGYYYHWAGSDNVKRTVAAHVENSHLTITDIDDGSAIIAEADGIISAYFIEIGNGGVPYIYLVKKDGSVARINISENGARTIEDLDGYEKIVSIFSGGDLYAHLIDINGNVYKNS